MKQVVLTVAGLEKLEQELDMLKSIKRQEVAEKIKVAISFGDLSENAEYDEAKNEQAQLETRIQQIEVMLKNVKVIDEDDVTTDKVSIGSKVTIYDVEYDEELEYTIVGSTEVDSSMNKISDESPIGHALIGCSVGDVIDVPVPSGTTKIEVRKITK